MKKIIFTICSNNYLAQAKTLGDSIKQYCPDYIFVIVLCDKKNIEIDYSFFSNFDFYEVSDLNIKKFSSMVKQYDIVELNTSIKPFAFEFLYSRYDADIVMYFDPDICLFSGLDELEKLLETNSIVLTPHIVSPIEFDSYTPSENTFTNYGLYNLGFLGTKKSNDTQKLLMWWQKRMETNCFINVSKGVFVDQLPINYVPLFFEDVYITKNLGMNMAPWNLHERKLTKENNVWIVNKQDKLVFYHFSNCNPNSKILSTHYTRYTFENCCNELKNIYIEYKQKVIENKFNSLSVINCFYMANGKKISIIKVIKKYIKKYFLFLFRKNFWRGQK